MPLPEKAHAYIDLLLAPSGEAVLLGEPAAICNQLPVKATDLDNCTGDDLEVLTAICGMAMKVAAAPGMPAGRDALVDAFKSRPEAFATLFCFMAYTPLLSSNGNMMGPDSVDCKNARELDDADLPKTLSSAQDADTYLRVITCCVKLFLTLATSSAAKELCKSRHFDDAALRLVELAGRQRPPINEKALAEFQLAVLARDTLCAITSFGTEEACSFVNEAHHPFLPSVSAASLIASVRSPSGIDFVPKPLWSSCEAEGIDRPSFAESDTAQYLLCAASLSILSRCRTGLWLAPISTLRPMWPWLAPYVVLPSGIRVLAVPLGCFFSGPAMTMGITSRILTALALTIPTGVVFDQMEEVCVKYFLPARMKRLLGYP